MRKLFGFVFAALFAVCIYGIYSPMQADAASLGFMNVRAVFANYPDMQTTNAALNMERQKVQEEFDKQANGLSDSGKKALFEKLNRQFMQRENQLLTPVREKLQKAVAKVAKAKGLDTVVDASVIIYGGTDITNDVIAQLKAM